MLNLQLQNVAASVKKSTAETKQQVFTEVSWEAEGENAAAGEHLENRRGFYIYTEMRKGGERACARLCACMCVQVTEKTPG